MARKLKTFVTTSGFFELAVAAPSKKAATELLGIRESAFAQGFARETEDASVVDATLERPGTVLRRAVGTQGAFKENAELPKLSALQRALGRKRPEHAPPKKNDKPASKLKAKKADVAAQQKAAQLYDLAERRRRKEEERAQAQREKEAEQRRRDIDRAQSAFDAAKERHEERLADIHNRREALDRKEEIEGDRWDEEQAKLKGALREAESE